MRKKYGVLFKEKMSNPIAKQNTSATAARDSGLGGGSNKATDGSAGAPSPGEKVISLSLQRSLSLYVGIFNIQPTIHTYKDVSQFG